MTMPRQDMSEDALSRLIEWLKKDSRRGFFYTIPFQTYDSGRRIPLDNYSVTLTLGGLRMIVQSAPSMREAIDKSLKTFESWRKN